MYLPLTWATVLWLGLSPPNLQWHSFSTTPGGDIKIILRRTSWVRTTCHNSTHGSWGSQHNFIPSPLFDAYVFWHRYTFDSELCKALRGAPRVVFLVEFSETMVVNRQEAVESS